MSRKKQVAENAKYIETGTTLLTNAIDTRGDYAIVSIDNQSYVAVTTTMHHMSRISYASIGDPIPVPEILYRVKDGQCYILTNEEVRLLKKAYCIVNEGMADMQSSMQLMDQLLESEGTSDDYEGARINPFAIKEFVAESFAKQKLV